MKEILKKEWGKDEENLYENHIMTWNEMFLRECLKMIKQMVKENVVSKLNSCTRANLLMDLEVGKEIFFINQV